MPVTRGDAEGGLGDLGVAVDLEVGGHVVGEGFDSLSRAESCTFLDLFLTATDN